MDARSVPPARDHLPGASFGFGRAERIRASRNMLAKQQRAHQDTGHPARPVLPGLSPPRAALIMLMRLRPLPPQGYRDWCRHVDLPERISELTLEKLRNDGEVVVSWGLLAKSTDSGRRNTVAYRPCLSATSAPRAAGRSSPPLPSCAALCPLALLMPAAGRGRSDACPLSFLCCKCHFAACLPPPSRPSCVACTGLRHASKRDARSAGAAR